MQWKYPQKLPENRYLTKYCVRRVGRFMCMSNTFVLSNSSLDVTCTPQVYPVGIPVLYAYILWINRESLNPEIETGKVSPAQLEEILEKRRENPELVPSMFLWKDFGESFKLT